MYVWFNDLHEQASQQVQHISDLADAEIADMARKVYLNFREEIDVEMSEIFRMPPEDQASLIIPEEERAPLLRSMLAEFDLADAADANARMVLKQRGVTLAPDAPAYTKLIRRVREALTQVHVDAVNLYANTPSKEDNPYFIDPETQEPKQPSSSSSRPVYNRSLQTLIPSVLDEVQATRGYKGLEKITHTLRLMSEFFGHKTDVSTIDRQGIIAFRNALEKLPTNATKRYPNKTILQVIEERSPDHQFISISHLNGHLRNVRQFFRICARNDPTLIVPNLEKIDLVDPIDSLDKKFPFTIEQLVQVLSKAADHQPEHHPSPMLWICMIALYHGLRANEISSLKNTDIVAVHGTTCIDLKIPDDVVERFRKGRSKTIPRILPIHPFLIDLGFPQYVASRPDGLIFPNLSKSKDGYYSRQISDWCADTISSLGWKGQKLSFHSFRHNFLDALDDDGLPEKWKAYLGGWKLDGVMNKNYGSSEMKESIIPAIGKIHYQGITPVLRRLTQPVIKS